MSPLSAISSALSNVKAFMPLSKQAILDWIVVDWVTSQIYPKVKARYQTVEDRSFVDNLESLGMSKEAVDKLIMENLAKLSKEDSHTILDLIVSKIPQKD